MNQLTSSTPRASLVFLLVVRLPPASMGEGNMAWALSDMTRQNYSFNAKTIIDKLRHAHLTEKVEVHLPLTFPCKDICEKVNTTLEGLAVKDRLEGSPDFLEGHHDDVHDDDDDVDDDDENDDDGDGGDDKPKKGKITNRVKHQEEEFNRMMGKMDIKLDKEKSDGVEVVDGPPLPPRDGEPPYDGPKHHSMGNLLTVSSTSTTSASMSNSTNVDNLIELVHTVAKKYEDHQDQRAAIVLNGGHSPPRREMSSFVVENLKKKLISSRRSS